MIISQCYRIAQKSLQPIARNSRLPYTKISNCYYERTFIRRTSTWQKHTSNSANDIATKKRRRIVIISIISGVTLSIYIVSHIEPAPYTGRKRLILISQADELAIGEMSCAELKKEFGAKLLPPTHPAVQTVKRVGATVLRGVGDEVPGAELWDWEYFVVRDPDTINAFVLPGGKVFVFSGLFKIAPTEADLAAVLAHEAGHALARHYSEKHAFGLFSQLLLFVELLLGFDPFVRDITATVTNLGIVLPNSRRLELEADDVGMRLMARSCVYHPQESLNMLKRLRALSKGESGLVKLMSRYVSTHPAGDDRVAHAKDQLPLAVAEMHKYCRSYVYNAADLIQDRVH